MPKLAWLLLWTSIGLAAPLGQVQAQPAAGGATRPAGRPELWMGPPERDDGRCFRELFQQPDAWKETRSVVDVLMYADHNLKRHISDDELRAWLAQMRQWNLKLALEVGAVKPWGPTGQKCFAADRPAWDRVERLGGSFTPSPWTSRCAAPGSTCTSRTTTRCRKRPPSSPWSASISPMC